VTHSFFIRDSTFSADYIRSGIARALPNGLDYAQYFPLLSSRLFCWSLFIMRGSCIDTLTCTLPDAMTTSCTIERDVTQKGQDEKGDYYDGETVATAATSFHSEIRLDRSDKHFLLERVKGLLKCLMVVILYGGAIFGSILAAGSESCYVGAYRWNHSIGSSSDSLIRGANDWPSFYCTTRTNGYVLTDGRGLGNGGAVLVWKCFFQYNLRYILLHATTRQLTVVDNAAPVSPDDFWLFDPGGTF
jgi:hypothetical protein